MRSLLFAPGDSDRKLDKALASGADAVIVDLEDSVASANKQAARAAAAAFLARARGAGPKLIVRVNPLTSGLTDEDLAAVMPGGPDAIMLPKAETGADVQHLSNKLAVAEAYAGLADGATRVIPIATETAAGIFGLSSYAGCSPRLEALVWGAEDLSADIGGEANRDADGRFTPPYRLARDLMLFAAASARVAAIDTVNVDFRNEAGLRAECEEARRDGFSGKLAIHPAQVAVINEVFTPDGKAVARAARIVAAFAENPSLGVVGMDGEMVDRPHLLRAERVLARAKAAGMTIG